MQSDADPKSLPKSTGVAGVPGKTGLVFRPVSEGEEPAPKNPAQPTSVGRALIMQGTTIHPLPDEEPDPDNPETTEPQQTKTAIDRLMDDLAFKQTCASVESNRLSHRWQAVGAVSATRLPEPNSWRLAELAAKCDACGFVLGKGVRLAHLLAEDSDYEGTRLSLRLEFDRAGYQMTLVYREGYDCDAGGEDNQWFKVSIYVDPHAIPHDRDKFMAEVATVFDGLPGANEMLIQGRGLLPLPETSPADKAAEVAAW